MTLKTMFFILLGIALVIGCVDGIANVVQIASKPDTRTADQIIYQEYKECIKGAFAKDLDICNKYVDQLAESEKIQPSAPSIVGVDMTNNKFFTEARDGNENVYSVEGKDCSIVDVTNRNFWSINHIGDGVE